MAQKVTMLERSMELALALEHMHYHLPDMFIVHRDLKPDNVGFKADGTLKLVSFGVLLFILMFLAHSFHSSCWSCSPVAARLLECVRSL